MESISINDLKNFEIDISLTNLVISLLTSIVCAYVIKIVYLKYAKTLNNKENFSDVFILLSITTTIVITVVKFSLALSLGLVGALSIVRFRAAIKEPEELVYLFMIIGIGLASGSAQFEVAFILTGAAFVIIFISDKFSKKKITFNSEILNIDISKNDYDAFSEKLKNVSAKNKIEIELKSLNKQDEKFHIVYIVKNLYETDKAEILINELKKINNLNFALSKDIHLPL